MRAAKGRKLTPAQRAVYQGSIRPPAAKVREVRCHPLCRGAASADWASCVPGCRACRPFPVAGPNPHPGPGRRPERLRG